MFLCVIGTDCVCGGVCGGGGVFVCVWGASRGGVGGGVRCGCVWWVCCVCVCDFGRGLLHVNVGCDWGKIRELVVVLRPQYQL